MIRRFGYFINRHASDLFKLVSVDSLKSYLDPLKRAIPPLEKIPPTKPTDLPAHQPDDSWDADPIPEIHYHRTTSTGPTTVSINPDTATALTPTSSTPTNPPISRLERLKLNFPHLFRPG
jgi:hypothetical protein